MGGYRAGQKPPCNNPSSDHRLWSLPHIPSSPSEPRSDPQESSCLTGDAAIHHSLSGSPQFRLSSCCQEEGVFMRLLLCIARRESGCVSMAVPLWRPGRAWCSVEISLSQEEPASIAALLPKDG